MNADGATDNDPDYEIAPSLAPVFEPRRVQFFTRANCPSHVFPWAHNTRLMYLNVFYARSEGHEPRKAPSADHPPGLSAMSTCSNLYPTNYPNVEYSVLLSRRRRSTRACAPIDVFRYRCKLLYLSRHGIQNRGIGRTQRRESLGNSVT